MMLFGEKYGDEVRVLDIGSSRELCGGTHVARTGDIGFFKIVAEGGVAAGIRRVEAVTGDNALAWVQAQEATIAAAAAALKAPAAEIEARIAQLIESAKTAERELAKLKAKLAASAGDDLAGGAVDVKGAKVLATMLDGADAKGLRETLDKLKDKLGSAAIVLSAVVDGKVSLIAGVTADLTAKVKAGELVNHVARQVGGKGGGRPDMAQAGGTDPAGLPAALASVRDWVAAAALTAVAGRRSRRWRSGARIRRVRPRPWNEGRSLTLEQAVDARPRGRQHRPHSIRSKMPLRPGLTLDMMNARGQGRLPGLVGFRVMALEQGLLVAEIDIRPDLLAPNGYLHAATVVALADTACGYGCIAHLPDGAENFTTVEFKSNFSAPRATARSRASPRPRTSAGRRRCGTRPSRGRPTASRSRSSVARR